MPSITYWNRLEPRSRTASLTQSLAASVRDPLWFLTRQWQFGEFHGEDAGSPAYVQFSASLEPFVGWGPEGQGLRPIAESAPLETLCEAEPFNPGDMSLRVELGQTFELLLEQAGLGSLREAFREAYPFEAAEDDALSASPEPEAGSFARVYEGRAIDGVKLYWAVRAAGGSLPPAPFVDAPHRAGLLAVMRALVEWVQEVFGDVGWVASPSGELRAEDPPAWRPERLEYGIEVAAAAPSGNSLTVMAAHPDPDANFSWYSFDFRGDLTIDPSAPPDVAPRPPSQAAGSVLPMNVRFRGMPNARWWDFENGNTDFGGMFLDRVDVAKLFVMDFMLVNGNDWFVIPLKQPVGSLCRVDTLMVRDVFGGTTLVERADASAPGGGQRWTMFSMTVERDPSRTADIFALPPSSAASAQVGPILEEVRFLRDEVANMVWAVEHLTEGGIGHSWPGHERAVALKASATSSPPAPGRVEEDVPLRYRLQTFVPENWIPFLPVALDPARGDVTLERGEMLGVSGRPTQPAGKILRPTGLHNPNIYQVREEEVQRTGLCVMRFTARSRWTDGSTHLWVARRKRASAGEGSSGLRFDIVEPNP